METSSVLNLSVSTAASRSPESLVQQMSDIRTRVDLAESRTAAMSFPTEVSMACLSFAAAATAKAPFLTKSSSSLTLKNSSLPIYKQPIIGCMTYIHRILI